MATTGELEARISDLEAKLRAMEAGKHEGAIPTLLDALFPTDVRHHLRAARKEQLLAVRSFLDHWIEAAGEEDAGSRRRESISVE